MSSMSNIHLRNARAPNAMDPRRPRGLWRRAESNHESDYTGSNNFNIPPNRGLRRIASTMDLFSGNVRQADGGSRLQRTVESSSLLQHVTESNMLLHQGPTQLYDNDSYSGKMFIGEDSESVNCYTKIAGSVGSEDSLFHGSNMTDPSSKRAPFPTTNSFFETGAFFGPTKPLDDDFKTPLQPPIARPKLHWSHSDPTAANSAVNTIMFPKTAEFTPVLWGLYEEDIKKALEGPRLRKEHTDPTHKFTTQPEWPPLRHSYGVARDGLLALAQGGRINERERALKTFGGFNIPRNTLRNANNSGTHNLNGVQLRLSGSPPTNSIRYPSISGKQLIEDLDEEENAAQVARHREQTYFNNDNNCSVEEKGSLPLSQPNLLHPATHDKDGRRRRAGFKRGDEALEAAISEDWVVMRSIINSPMIIAPLSSRYYVIKSNCELDVYASLKHGIWTSTDLGNQRLDKAFRDTRRRGHIYLFFSVSGSGKYCGVAEMTSPVDLSAHAGCWSDKRWRGRFSVQWKIVKDVHNCDLRHFRVINNDYKPFTNCRDTQEILPDTGDRIMNQFINYTTPYSLLHSPNPIPKYEDVDDNFLI